MLKLSERLPGLETLSRLKLDGTTVHPTAWLRATVCNVWPGALYIWGRGNLGRDHNRVLE